MPATSSRKHSPANIMARHRTLRRAMASASAKMPRRLCILGVDRLKFRDAECTDATMLAPGALARHFWGDMSVNHMPAMASRKHSLPNTMARHRTLRRAMAPTSAKMPRRLCLLGLTAGKCRDAEWATRPLSAQGALAPRFWGNASANHMSVTSLREHSPPNQMARHRTLRRAVASASAKMPPRLCVLG